MQFDLSLLVLLDPGHARNGDIIDKAGCALDHDLQGLAAGFGLRSTMDLAREFRKDDDATPIILMGYLNPIESLGYDAFADYAAASGVDGLIVVDCPPEEAAPASASLTPVTPATAT